jgi:hypothetical protein
VKLEDAFPCLALHCGVLRSLLTGEEVSLLDLVGVSRHHYQGIAHSQPKKRHTVAAFFLGRSKTALGERYYLMPWAKKTASGLSLGVWTRIMLEQYREHGEPGMAQCFGAKDGDRAKASDFQMPIPEKLLEAQLGQPELISRDMEVAEECGLLRSFG